jgi:hypothetical protein
LHGAAEGLFCFGEVARSQQSLAVLKLQLGLEHPLRIGCGAFGLLDQIDLVLVSLAQLGVRQNPKGLAHPSQDELRPGAVRGQPVRL